MASQRLRRWFAIQPTVGKFVRRRRQRGYSAQLLRRRRSTARLIAPGARSTPGNLTLPRRLWCASVNSSPKRQIHKSPPPKLVQYTKLAKGGAFHLLCAINVGDFGGFEQPPETMLLFTHLWVKILFSSRLW